MNWQDRLDLLVILAEFTAAWLAFAIPAVYAAERVQTWWERRWVKAKSHRITWL